MYIYMVQFFSLFIVLLVISALAINGWYNITRGRWETGPDGSKKWVGKIFNFWGKFLQQHTSGIEYYTNDEFLKEFSKIREFFKDDDIHEIVSNGIIAKSMNAKKAALLFTYARKMGVNISLTDQPETEGHKSGTAVTIYKEIFKYKIPYWLRYPLGECLSCAASFYGTICWIFFYYLLKDSGYTFLSELSFVFKAGLWVIFLVSLSYLNELVFNINYSKSK